MDDEMNVLVTGGNRGIGLGIVDAMSKEGWKVYMACRKVEEGEQAKASLERSENVEVIHLDLSDPESIQKAVEKIKNECGALDVLINNAGIIGSRKSDLKAGDIEEAREIMDTNFFGPMQVNAAFLDLLRHSDEGRIINISSGMGAMDGMVGGYAGYRLSKAGLNAQTMLLASELSDEDIKVMAMCPGWVQTNMGGSNAPRSVREGADTAVFLATSDKVQSGKFYRDRQIIPW